MPNQIPSARKQRVILPEILDSLPYDAPEALANRRDLRLLNRLMGNFRWVAAELQGGLNGQGTIEWGAGDGALAQHLARAQILTPGDNYSGVDLAPAPANWSWNWIRGDLRDIPLGNKVSLLLANLILHQFSREELRQLGLRIEESAITKILANEPTRRRRHVWQLAATHILGIHPVSWHDGRVSIRAGFRRNELMYELGLDPSRWKINWSETFFGANRLVLSRK